VCLLRGTDWVFKSNRYSFVLKGLKLGRGQTYDISGDQPAVAGTLQDVNLIHLLIFKSLSNKDLVFIVHMAL
jgi:ribosomal protein L30/L7E